MNRQMGFEADLHAWITRVYERRTGVVRSQVEERVLLLLDREKRWLIPLMAGVVLGVAMLPVWGAAGVVGSLAVLYVGAFLSGIVTMRRTERVEHTLRPREDGVEAARQAWETRPALGAEERAYLVRIMNLAQASAAPGAQPLLRGEVREAMRLKTLAGWRFLRDLDDLLARDAAALA